MNKNYLIISTLITISILSVLLYSESKYSTVVSNHEELKVIDISEFRNASSNYATPSLKLAQEAGFNTNLIHIKSVKFKNVKKPILEGYVRATDYLTKGQVVKTSNVHDPEAIVYMLQSESTKIKQRGYLWCTKQITIKSDDLGYSASRFEYGKDDEAYKKHVDALTSEGFTNINTFVNESALLGLSRTKNDYSSGAIQIITAGRLLDMYTFSCNKESQLKIEKELIEWAKLLIEANQ